MEKYILFDEYITLGQLLKEEGLIATGGQAKLFLADQENQILYNGQPENRRGKKLRSGDQLEFLAFDKVITFEQASPEASAERQADQQEEARVKALVKQMNAQQQPKKSKKPAAPHFPGRK